MHGISHVENGSMVVLTLREEGKAKETEEEALRSNLMWRTVHGYIPVRDF